MFRFYCKEAPYDLWPATRAFRSEHIGPLLAVIASERKIQARFLVAAHVEGGDAVLQKAGGLLALIDRTSHLPGCWKSLGKHWPSIDAAPLAKAAAVALGSHGGPPDLTETLAFYGIAYVLVRVSPDNAVLNALQSTSAGNDTIARLRKAVAET